MSTQRLVVLLATATLLGLAIGIAVVRGTAPAAALDEASTTGSDLGTESAKAVAATPSDALRSAKPGTSTDAARGAEGQSTRAPAPLPPLDAPVAEIYEDLADRARRGDVRAACRLGSDLWDCAERQMVRRIDPEVESRRIATMRQRGESDVAIQRAVDRAAVQQERSDRLDKRCGNVQPARIDEAFDWMLMAAEQGNAFAMVRFAGTPMVPADRHFIEVERLAVYRDRAPVFAQRGLARGDLRMLLLVGMLASPQPGQGWSPLAQVMKLDPAQAYAYSQLAGGLLSGSPDDPPEPELRRLERQRAALTPAQLASADDELRKLRAGAYANLHPTDLSTLIGGPDGDRLSQAASCESDP